ncbi:hypothetical protein VOLCADRAFT_96152 [Volvox carteri f. nagariensis]|uniref:Uncharacterized protein n=1 Tax=Volvox carteri f. nagariensis TaxID=3068 RepID=D8U9C5_VOLCA|nr:uncharacterized protein VOLCADRAFT_96152 [Volvox carteri f. nagariensis]EFJ43732.1 hypothetical protein VOLCADRAFT_96152 [Volvox carteri f. nagariensis]|eukprot:XP_002955213.1 hypothetical protein VOLCADRAFT_96152 [Volvox carteri f. nagariensis]
MALSLGAGEGDRDRALVAASAAGRRRVVRLLLANGADPEAAEAYGYSALYEAARNGNTDVVEVLLDAGARIDGATAAAAAMPYEGRIPSMFGSWSVPRPSAAPPPANPHSDPDPGKLRPTAISGGGGGGNVNLPGAVAPYPPPLRAPFPLAAGMISGDGDGGGGGSPAAGLVVPAPKVFDPEEFYRDSDSGGGGGAAVATPRRWDEYPKTPTATAAAAAAKAWDSDDDDDDDDDDDEGAGGAGAGKAGGAFAGSGTIAGDTGVSGAGGPRTSVQVGGLNGVVPLPPRLPPPLPRRKQPLPLPPNLAALPLMPSLTYGAPPPLPPPLMLLLAGPGERSISPRRSGPSPLLAAIQGGHAATVALLLHRGAKVDTDGGAELLAAAHPQIVDGLMAAVPGLSAHLGPALLAAASSNRVNVVSALLRHGADPTFRGGMALQEAAFRSHVDVLKVLLQADRDRLRDIGAVEAALKWARCFGRMEVLKLLGGLPFRSTELPGSGAADPGPGHT